MQLEIYRPRRSEYLTFLYSISATLEGNDMSLEAKAKHGPGRNQTDLQRPAYPRQVPDVRGMVLDAAGQREDLAGAVSVQHMYGTTGVESGEGVG